jgi:membrane-associated phospholipid phosphatase
LRQKSGFHRYVFIIIGSVSLALSAPASGQSADSTATANAPLFTIRDAYIGAGFALATIALLPFDKHIAQELQDSATQANKFFGGAATDFERAAVPGTYVVGGLLYGVGRIGHFREIADLGLHGTEAVFLAIQLTDIVKGLAGRARPFLVGDSLPGNFQFARGLRKTKGYTSFPSGHTAKAFGAASAVTAEVDRVWPRATWIVAPAMYGGALMVGLSRMYHNAHWASDVALGAGIGTFSGLKVVRYNHTHPHNRIDRWLLGARVYPNDRGGVDLSFSM